MDTLFGIPAAQHGVGDHSQISNISHASRQSRTTINIRAESNTILSHQLNRTVHYTDPLVNRHLEFFRSIFRTEVLTGILPAHDCVNGLNGHCRIQSGDFGRVPESLPQLPRAPVKKSFVMEIIPDLEPHHATLGNKLFQ